MKNPKKFLKSVFIILLAIIISGYAFFQAKDMIIGPVIKINSPQNGALIDDSLIEIKGNAKNISYISMNDNQIFTDDKGVFGEKLLLSYGYNIITIEAKDRFGRKIKKTLELIYK